MQADIFKFAMKSLDERITAMEDAIAGWVTPGFVRQYFPIGPNDSLRREFTPEELEKIDSAVAVNDPDIEMKALSRDDRLLQAHKIGSILLSRVIDREDMSDFEANFYHRVMNNLPSLIEQRAQARQSKEQK